MDFKIADWRLLRVSPGAVGRAVRDSQVYYSVRTFSVLSEIRGRRGEKGGEKKEGKLEGKGLETEREERRQRRGEVGMGGGGIEGAEQERRSGWRKGRK